MDKILVAIDGSETADRAVDFAVRLAKQADAELAILNVGQETTLVAVPMGVVGEVENVYMTPRDVLEAAATKLLDLAAERAEIAGLERVDRLIRYGPPAKTIVDTAGEIGADVIVMGRRGLGDLGGLILGSVTHKVSHLADLPVVTVP